MRTFKITTTIMVSNETYKNEVEELKEQVRSGEYANDLKDDDTILDCRVEFEDLAYNISKVKK